MKRVLIKEGQLLNVLTEANQDIVELPTHIMSSLKQSKTSLGEHPAYPPSHNKAFDEKIVLVEYNQLINDIKGLDLGIDVSNETELRAYTQNLLNEIIELEKPIRKQLEELCQTKVLTLFNFINKNDVIKLNCKLVDEVSILDNENYLDIDIDDITFDSIDSSDELHDEIYKRRLVLSLISGGAKNLNLLIDSYVELFDLNIKLPELYYKIEILLNYLTFISMDDNGDNSLLMSTNNGEVGDDFNISVTALIYPLLIKESIKSIFNLISMFTIPFKDDRGEYLLSITDNVIYELWDERLGSGLWMLLIQNIDKTDIIYIPELFTRIIKLSPKNFNNLMREVLGVTKRGGDIINNLIEKIKYKSQYDLFLNKINDKSQILDTYIKSNEL